MECDEITSIEIPGSVAVIQSRTFYDCIGLKEVIIHKGTAEIENGAFEKCNNLSKIVLPSDDIEIYDDMINSSGILTVERK